MISEKDKFLIRGAQEYARKLKTYDLPVVCPFGQMITDLHSTMDTICRTCFEWLDLEWKGKFFDHPCLHLSDEEIKKRFWKNTGT